MFRGKTCKELYTEYLTLKHLNQKNLPNRFEILQSVFDDDHDEIPATASCSEGVFIHGYIFPRSEIYSRGKFKVEMKFPSTYPADPPKVCFLTKIYHPNIDENGTVCIDLLKKTAEWAPNTKLVRVIDAIYKCVDNPDVIFPLRADVAHEYIYERHRFNQIALDHVNKYCEPRKDNE